MKALHGIRCLLPKSIFLLDDFKRRLLCCLFHITEIREQKLAFRRDEKQRIVTCEAAEVAQIDELAHDHRFDALLLHEAAQTFDALSYAHRTASFIAPSFIKAISSAPR